MKVIIALMIVVMVALSGSLIADSAAYTGPIYKEPFIQKTSKVFMRMLIRADSGEPKDQLSLGYMYLKGESVPQDSTKGIEWIKMAAAQGYGEACYFLGMLYLTGKYVEQDIVKARSYIKRANVHNYKPTITETLHSLDYIIEEER